jgi:hypothetical protein
MSIPTPQPPSNLPPDLERWLLDFQTQVSGAFNEIESELELTKKQVQLIKAHVGMP